MEASLGGGNRRTQRRGRPTAIRQEHIRNTTQDDNRQNLLQVQDAEDQAKKILDDALKIKDEKDSIVAEKQRQIEDWINEQEFATEEDFFEYAMNDVIKPGIKKYNKLYEDPASDHHLFHKGILACKLFNPFFIKDASTNVLLLLIDQLKFFGPGFKEFSTDYFIEGLKNELATLETVVKKPYNWLDNAESKQYQNRKDRRKRRDKKRLELAQECERGDQVETTAGRINMFDDWKQDPGELARRIYVWWGDVLKANEKELSYFKTAVRLIALVQVSSASVKRVFSQMQYIIRACGGNMLQETLYLRTLCRYENGQGEDYGDEENRV